MAGLGEDIKAADSIYYNAVTVPANTNTDSTALRTEVEAIQGAQSVYVKVDTDIVITDTKVVTVIVEDSADNITFTQLAELYTVTASGETTLDAGGILAQYVLPDNAKAYTRLNVATDDTGVVGKLTAYLRYLPR